MREIYRKLASELHPDRELDADQRTRKTALMQQANQAYAASYLLTLLGMQLQLDQLAPVTLSGLAHERLLHYNHLLTDQCEQLRTELADLTAPFAMSIERGARELTPATVISWEISPWTILRRWTISCWRFHRHRGEGGGDKAGWKQTVYSRAHSATAGEPACAVRRMTPRAADIIWITARTTEEREGPRRGSVALTRLPASEECRQ